jgi:hypothetical protein
MNPTTAQKIPMSTNPLFYTQPKQTEQEIEIDMHDSDDDEEPIDLDLDVALPETKEQPEVKSLETEYDEEVNVEREAIYQPILSFSELMQLEESAQEEPTRLRFED